ncbi:MAG: hypothetical protein IT204_24595 [Fimbriimonadaceae bacterium]|nr:hypothetical protein [Fimbriimonadaceae bacterium]
MIPAEQLQKLWSQVRTKVKAVDINPPLYRALDLAVPVTLDGTVLVVGLDPADQHEASQFDLPANRAVIDKVLARIVSKPLTLQLIDGTTVEEYERWKERAAATAALRQRTVEVAEARAAKDDAAAAAEAGEEVADSGDGSSVNRLLLGVTRDFHNGYRQLANRTQSLVRGRFVSQAIDRLLEAERQIADLEGPAAMKERLLSRAIDRLAEIVGTEPLVVALELERRRPPA